MSGAAGLMDVSPLTVLLGGIVVALVGYLGIRYKSQRETSGGVAETPADSLWRVMEGRVKAGEEKAVRQDEKIDRLEAKLDLDRSTRDAKIDALNDQLLTLRTENLDKERASRTEIEALTARVKDLEGQLAAALAEVKSLRAELGRPTAS